MGSLTIPTILTIIAVLVLSASLIEICIITRISERFQLDVSSIQQAEIRLLNLRFQHPALYDKYHGQFLYNKFIALHDDLIKFKEKSMDGLATYNTMVEMDNLHVRTERLTYEFHKAINNICEKIDNDYCDGL